MISPSISLTLAFLRARPDAAAKILEQHTSSDVSEFFRKIPSESASLVISRMLPYSAARAIEPLENESATSILSHLDPTKTANLLRHLSSSSREAILAKLPAKIRKPCKTLLAHDEKQVGAWMRPNPIALSIDVTVEEAINTLRTQLPTAEMERVFVIDRDGFLKGSIPLSTLISAQSEQTVATLVNAKPRSVTAQAYITSLDSSPIWNGRDLLPVVDQQKRLVGTLRHSDFRNARSQLTGQKLDHSEPHLAPTLFDVYLNTLWTLVTSVIGEYAPKSKN